MSKAITRWEPFNEMVSLRDAVNQLFQDSFIRPGSGLMPFDMTQPAVDVIENKNEIIVKASLPGIKPDDIDITLTGDQLTLKGETKSEQKIEEGNYVRQERRFGAFQRTVTLPTSVVSDKAKAEFENGVLTLTLPKSEDVKPKSIKVKAINN
ncbi:MAG TPA: Hsp20/alpha crystallin family protein [Anaerolineae bacterium]|nr:Hsp20/alpha crystallin family protein [Anaerolineae bacterium]